MRKHYGKIITIIAFLLSVAVLFGVCYPASAASDDKSLKPLIGGGYAITGQVPGVGYTSELYDAGNGLPTSDANYILSSSDGYIWIGGYSGIIRYDGMSFERLDTSEGLTSGRGLFEDSKGRIWVGTNDNGVTVLDGNERIHFTYRDGLPSSSIRIFAEDKSGNIYIGTTAGVCYADEQMQIHVVDDERINEERVLRLESDSTGRIYGQTKSGIIFAIDNKSVSELYSSEDLGLETITTILADPNHDGKMYIGTDGGLVYYGEFGNSNEQLKCIDVNPINSVHWLSYDCEKVWVSSKTDLGYINERNEFHHIHNLTAENGIEMTTSDYQGNIWIASSTQGVYKVVQDQFVDLTKRADVPEHVANATCLYQDNLYIGTDKGLYIIDDKYNVIENELTEFIGDSWIRCIATDNDDNLWIATFTNGLGLVCYTSEGEIRNYTTENGMPSDEVRCISFSSDGTAHVGTNAGIVSIKDNEIVDVTDADSGIKNTVILTILDGDDGEVIAGTDGDGIYIIKDGDIRKIGRGEGLTSDVIMKVVKDNERDMYWIITSNSIEYMLDDEIKCVSSFPYNNNYDLNFDINGNMWIISSYGIYVVDVEAMLKNSIKEYKLYTLENGLTGTPTGNSFSAKDNDGYLYISARNGVCRVNMNSFLENTSEVMTSVGSLYCDEEQIFQDEKGIFTIPASRGRIKITPSVRDYSLINPFVKVYLEGREDEGKKVPKSELTPLEYTNLPYGKYILHIQVFDSSGNNMISDETFTIIKKARIGEMSLIRLLLFALMISVTGLIVWQVLRNTIIRKQRIELISAREEAERAGMARERFLANISHDIVTPINTIKGITELMRREEASTVPVPYFMSMMSYAFDIGNAAESLMTFANELIDLSEIESGKMELQEQEYSTLEVLRDIVTLTRIRCEEKELAFDVSIDEVCPVRLFGDIGKIKQIVINLLINGVKFTDEGSITFRVSIPERVDDICEVCFVIKDTGRGIKEEDKEKLFNAFEQMSEKKDNEISEIGMGLDISRRFSKLLGASFTCESEFGKGAEFVFKVKQKIVDSNPIGVFTETDAIKLDGPYMPKFIAPDAEVLVADDSVANLVLIKKLLKPTRVFVSTATSIGECLEKIKTNECDVVFIDYMMADLAGESIEKIRETNPDLPVYAITTNTATEEEFYKEKGYSGFLPKPIDGDVLEGIIMRHIRDEKMEKPSMMGSFFEELADFPTEMRWINDVEGLDISKGIENSGGIANYIFSLRIFLGTIDSNVEIARKAWKGKDFPMFIAKIRIIKDAGNIVGADRLSEMAAKMEIAGKKEDREYIGCNLDALLDTYAEFKVKLSRL